MASSQLTLWVPRFPNHHLIRASTPRPSVRRSPAFSPPRPALNISLPRRKSPENTRFHHGFDGRVPAQVRRHRVARLADGKFPARASMNMVPRTHHPSIANRHIPAPSGLTPSILGLSMASVAASSSEPLLPLISLRADVSLAHSHPSSHHSRSVQPHSHQAHVS